MTRRMLIDATQPEEVRVVVINGNKLEELDFEIASRKQLKGNIYLAKVTRVEPSLQAAFVEYGGNRHGFLAFSEIHPDYYRIPKSDRDRLFGEDPRLDGPPAAVTDVSEESDGAEDGGQAYQANGPGAGVPNRQTDHDAGMPGAGTEGTGIGRQVGAADGTHPHEPATGADYSAGPGGAAGLADAEQAGFQATAEPPTADGASRETTVGARAPASGAVAGPADATPVSGPEASVGLNLDRNQGSPEPVAAEAEPAIPGVAPAAAGNPPAEPAGPDHRVSHDVTVASGATTALPTNSPDSAPAATGAIGTAETPEPRSITNDQPSASDSVAAEPVSLAVVGSDVSEHGGEAEPTGGIAEAPTESVLQAAPVLHGSDGTADQPDAATDTVGIDATARGTAAPEAVVPNPGTADVGADGDPGQPIPQVDPAPEPAVGAPSGAEISGSSIGPSTQGSATAEPADAGAARTEGQPRDPVPASAPLTISGFARISDAPEAGAALTSSGYEPEELSGAGVLAEDSAGRERAADQTVGEAADWSRIAGERDHWAPALPEPDGETEEEEGETDIVSKAEAWDGASIAENGSQPLEVPEPVEAPDEIGGDEIEEEVVRRRYRPLRHYKIQEVVKRRQIILVQVTKEERGNKGAALTTYLSLPGRYCVLMPNTDKGGGISRKITNPADRKRLKEILAELDVPSGMAVILRTAGLERSKAEIKRDLEYLLRLWDNIRELTLESSAPDMIYEEANLIKRAIRDLYTNDIDEVLVEGEVGYRIAKDFMRMLMPSHAKKVQPYRDETMPLFHRYQVETQIETIHNPVAQLRSGGYIVINPTEALVAIDVNSGRSTRERNIEETALRTNLEAADEIARQLRLRDLAGLIVIDFIDMEDNRNNAAVERRLKEALKIDRARIQIGRISPFGLLELSRQRLRPSLQEINFERCPHCQGMGVIRTVEAAALHVMREIEEEGIRRRAAEISVYVPTQIALYILNNKRANLIALEKRYGMRTQLFADDSLIAPDLRLDRVKARTALDDAAPAIVPERIFAETDRLLELEAEKRRTDGSAVTEVEDEAEQPAETETTPPRESRARRDRRPRRRRPEPTAATAPAPAPAAKRDTVADAEIPYPLDQPQPDVGAVPVAVVESGESGHTDETDEDAEASVPGDESGDPAQRKRRRGKRGGRRRGRTPRRPDGEAAAAPGEDGEVGADDGEAASDDAGDEPRVVRTIPITEVTDTALAEADPGSAGDGDQLAAPAAAEVGDAKPADLGWGEPEPLETRAVDAAPTGPEVGGGPLAGPSAIATDMSESVPPGSPRIGEEVASPVGAAPSANLEAPSEPVVQATATLDQPSQANSDMGSVEPMRLPATMPDAEPETPAPPGAQADSPATLVGEDQPDGSGSAAALDRTEDPSGDQDAPPAPEAPPENLAAAAAEVVNEPPPARKRGWWGKSVGR